MAARLRVYRYNYAGGAAALLAFFKKINARLQHRRATGVASVTSFTFGRVITNVFFGVHTYRGVYDNHAAGPPFRFDVNVQTKKNPLSKRKNTDARSRRRQYTKSVYGRRSAANRSA